MSVTKCTGCRYQMYRYPLPFVQVSVTRCTGVRYQMYRFIPYIERKEIIEIGKKERKRARGALPPAFPASFLVYGGVYGLAPPYLYKK